MASLDRSVWAAGFVFRSHGVRVGVRADDAACLQSLRDRLPPGARDCRATEVDVLFSVFAGGQVPGTAIRRFAQIYAGFTSQVRTHDWNQALDVFESGVRLEIAQAARRWTIVHAGVVAWRGRAIVIPGYSMSGKSRLVDALIAAGAEYYSDEFAPIDRRGRVHPFPKPIAIRQPDGSIVRRRIPRADSAKALPLGLVVSTEYREDGAWQPQPLSTAQSVMALLAHTVRARTDPAGTLRSLTTATASARGLAGPRGDAREVADRILSLD